MKNRLHTIKEYDEANRILINTAFDKLLLNFDTQPNSTPKKREKIIKAFNFAAEAHKEQKRKSGEAYFIHPVEVALICSVEIKLGATSIVCALLHDVVEDTPITIEEIEKEFGAKVAMIVGGLTKLDGSYKTSSLQAENFKKILSTLIEDVRVVLVKMADRLHNMRTIGALPHRKQLRIAAETDYVYIPLAYRLGLFNIKTEFENICLKVNEPDLYKTIKDKLSETAEKRNLYIESFITPIQKVLTGLDNEYRIFGRVKSIFSISKKMKAQGVDFEGVFDLFAVRIVINASQKKEKEACWRAFSLITDTYRPVASRIRDWLSNPKSNGYESLHTTIIGPKGQHVEVQIRSERMDEIAERGFAAHWRYKGIDSQKGVYDQWLDSVRDSLENVSNGDTIEFLEDFKANNLFKEEVFVNTPNGDVVVLPKGATALDFAFSIHTDVGYHCSAVKVGRKLVPMSYELQNGDQIEVLTSKNQRPSESWLKIVITGKARSGIRGAMREEKKNKGEFGREALARKLKNLKVNFDDVIDMLVQYFGYSTHTDFYYDIASDNFSVLEITKNFTPAAGKLVEIKKDVEVELTNEEHEEVKRPRKTSDTKPRLVINGEDAKRFDFTFANCCNAVQGDKIFAFVTTTAGLKIHRTNCPNATNMMAHYGYRVMKAEWVVTPDSKFVATLKIIGIDAGPGVIEKISHELSSMLGMDIRSFSIEGDEGYYIGKIGLLVSNIDHLNRAIRVLQNLDIVSSVQRIN